GSPPRGRTPGRRRPRPRERGSSAPGANSPAWRSCLVIQLLSCRARATARAPVPRGTRTVLCPLGRGSRILRFAQFRDDSLRLLGHVLAALGPGGIHGPHRIIEQDRLLEGAVAVEPAAHGAAVGTGVADLDVVALGDLLRQREWPPHVVDGIAGRAPE